MKYMGSKAKYAEEIIGSIFSSCNLWEFDNWVEPFVGMCNLMPKLKEYKIKWGNDIFFFCNKFRC